MNTRNVSALMLIAVLGYVSTASAVEFSFPGLSCNIFIESGGGQGFMYGNGSARNPSTTVNAKVLCPLQQFGTTEDALDFSVVVSDSHASKPVTCFVRTCEANGTACVSSSTASSGSTFTGTVQLSLNGISIVADGLTYLECSVPEYQGSYSSIISYRWKNI